MSEIKRTLKQRFFHGLREYLLISVYLFVVFSSLIIYKAEVLAEHEIEFVPQGLALINALALAKVILVGQELHLAEQFRDAPLIYPTLLKSFVYTLLLACFKILEEAAVGMYHGEPFGKSIAVFAGGTWKGALSLTVLLFVVLIPFWFHRTATSPRCREVTGRLFPCSASDESATHFLTLKATTRSNSPVCAFDTSLVPGTCLRTIS